MPQFTQAELSANILLGSHHGSLSFFDDPSDSQHYYKEHIKAISPAMTVISVGKNSHGHPKQHAIQLYENYSKGSDNGTKIARTDQQGNIKLILKGGGSWSMKYNQ